MHPCWRRLLLSFLVVLSVLFFWRWWLIPKVKRLLGSLWCNPQFSMHKNYTQNLYWRKIQLPSHFSPNHGRVRIRKQWWWYLSAIIYFIYGKLRPYMLTTITSEMDHASWAVIIWGQICWWAVRASLLNKLSKWLDRVADNIYWVHPREVKRRRFHSHWMWTWSLDDCPLCIGASD